MGIMQTTPSNLTHHFLIAMPHMADPRFDHSLIYLCEHSPEGAMGLIDGMVVGRGGRRECFA